MIKHGVATRPFVAEIDLALADKLRALLEDQGFTLTTAPHTVYAAQKKGVSCTLYQSGKLVIQGKEMGPFIEFYLEPEILGNFDFTHKSHEVDLTPRMGCDETGKGDFFGPLCVAGVFAEGDEIAELVKIGVRDSKTLSDKKIRALASQIQQNYTHHIIRIKPPKYNELYGKFQNLNHLLAWAHATVIQRLQEESHCDIVIVDQFANENVLLNAIQKKGVNVKTFQKTQAESDPVVAAGSILARAAFVEEIDNLSKEYEIDIPKGAGSQVLRIGRLLVAKHGPEILDVISKAHFKTRDDILR